MKDTTMKNYITVVYEAGGENEFVRTSDVAKTLGYRPSSVTETFQKMSQEGLIEYTPYRGVKLTDKGKEIAEKVIVRRRTLRRLLLYMDVPQELAETECRKIELIPTDEVTGYIRDFLIKQEGGQDD